MHPNIGAIVIHENGNIANNADLFCEQYLPQRLPLLIESKLQRAADLEVIGEFLARLLPWRWLRAAPIRKARFSSSLVCSANVESRTKRNRRATRHFLHKTVQSAAARAAALSQKAAARLEQQRHFLRKRSIVMDRAVSEDGLRKEQRAFEGSIQPRSARRSRLISSGFPANAEVEE